MPSSTLFDTAVDNHGLFSDYFLAERFPERDDVRALHDEADAAFAEVRALYARHHDAVDGWNEAQTEDEFVMPVLDVLGWVRRVQSFVQRQGRTGRPDYALFATEARRQVALDRMDGDETKVFDYADAVADAKYWGRPLDGPAPDPAREDTAAMRRQNPSFQIIDYVTLTGVDWGILTNGAVWRLYYADAPSRLETYFEVNLEHVCRLAEGTAAERAEARDAFRLFYALFRAAAYRPITEGRPFVELVYEASDTYAEELEDALKRRIFDHVFLELATGLYENHARRDGVDDPDAAVLDAVYRATLRLLYRLLFLLYAEARDLLPLDDPGYYEHSLTALAQRAKDDYAGGRTLSTRHPDLWNDLEGLFRTVHDGDPAFNVPAYNGGLFRLKEGANAFLDDHEIGERYVARALVNLTAVNPETEPTGPSVDYKSLDVRQLGSIYEGLLEHRLVRTEEGSLDLQTDKGERKATGSYYTPHYVVEYIVEHTLGPIVDARIERFEAAMAQIQEIVDAHPGDSFGRRAKLDKPRQRALDAFLTVRVCDPAMGSGHFLVYAADYLAERFAQVLGRFPEHNPVTERLDEIRGEIREDLARQGVTLDDAAHRLRDTSLLKRLVMKRCIYGVDLNPMAVELAKLSLWLHSFTVGAPLSFLDHHLKAGNSLVGTTVGEVKAALEAEGAQFEMFGGPFAGLLRATELMQEVAHLTDATLDEVHESAARFADYEAAVRPYKQVLDLWVSRHFENERAPYLLRQFGAQVLDVFRGETELSDEKQRKTLKQAASLSDAHRFFHWELEFPEVYYDLDRAAEKEHPGFDAVIGNPPWMGVRTGEIPDDFLGWLRTIYETAVGQFDLAAVFMEVGSNTTKSGGGLGFVVPKRLATNESYLALRDLLREQLGTLKHALDLGVAFQNVNNDALILIYGPEFGDDQAVFGERVRQTELLTWEVEEALIDSMPFHIIPVNDREPAIELVDKLVRGNSFQFGEVAKIDRGAECGMNHPAISKDVSDSNILPVADHLDVGPYAIFHSGHYLDPDQIEDHVLKSLDIYLSVPKLLIRFLSSVIEVGKDDRGYITTNLVYHVRAELDIDFSLSILSSTLLSFWYKTAFQNDEVKFPHVQKSHIKHLPIRQIDFTTPEDERAAHVEAAVDAYEEAVSATTPGVETRDLASLPTDDAARRVLRGVEAHLDATPERADVVHDLLAHLARAMTRMKEERHGYNLNIVDYVGEPSDGLTLREIGRYQPAPGVGDSLLAETTETREKLRVGTLSATRDGDAVTVYATARYKPDDADAHDTDRWDYTETAPLAVCELHGCADLEAGLVTHWLEALDAHGGGFAHYRDNATKTMSLRDRILAARFPDPDAVEADLRSFLANAAAAAELDRRLAFTDALIDRIVYRLYELSEEEVAVVEGRTA